MTLQDKHVLIIDDTSSIRSFLRISLEGQGAVTSEAATAEEGIALCHSRQPDLVVLDLGLPDRDGLDILAELCDAASPTVIVLTVRRDPFTRMEAIDRGASAYLTKPFLLDDLLETIEDHLPTASAA